MSALLPLLAAGQLIGGHAPWPCAVVDAATWEGAADQLAEGSVTLLSVWGEAGRVHMALYAPGEPPVCVLSLDCPEGRYPAVGRVHPAAIRLDSRGVRHSRRLDRRRGRRWRRRCGFGHGGGLATRTSRGKGGAAQALNRKSRRPSPP